MRTHTRAERHHRKVIDGRLAGLLLVLLRGLSFARGGSGLEDELRDELVEVGLFEGDAVDAVGVVVVLCWVGVRAAERVLSEASALERFAPCGGEETTSGEVLPCVSVSGDARSEDAPSEVCDGLTVGMSERRFSFSQSPSVRHSCSLTVARARSSSSAVAHSACSFCSVSASRASRCCFSR